MNDSAGASRLSPALIRAIFVAGLVVALALGLASQQKASPLARIDNLFLDAFVRASATDRPAMHAAVVDIDDVSLSAVGQWPWPRYRVASLIQRIAASSPAAIGLDVLFPEPDRTSLLNVQQTFKRDFGLDVSFAGVPAGLLDNDGFLGYEIGRSGVVASDYFYFDHVNKVAAPARPGIAFDGRTDLLQLNEATGILQNADAVSSQTRLTGFVNNQLDDDGVLRRLPLLIRHEGVVHANLALATVMRALDLKSGTIESDGDGLSIRIGAHRIPIDEAGYATLRFNGGPKLYSAISAVDVLNGSFRATDLAGRVVFIGSSAVGLNDIHTTAIDSRFPGLKVQAVMAENIVTDSFVRVPSWGSTAILVESVAAGALMAAIFVAGAGVIPTLLGSLLVIAVVVGASATPFMRSGLFVSPGPCVITVITLFVMFLATRFAIERRRAWLWHKRLENARRVTIESMAAVAETRDPETGAHIKRTQHYVKAIAEQMQRAGQHVEVLTREYIDLLFVSAPLHDIGKVGVPDHILLKPGRLTAAEFEIMKQHAEFGRKIIHSTAQRIEGDNFLIVAGQIAATHHEKWDGTGYPAGLAGADIPLAGRIMAVADVYDALISRRCYKEPFSHQLATTLMRDERGRIFDPEVLDAFFAIEQQIKEIAGHYRDEAEPEGEAEGHGRPVVVHGFSDPREAAEAVRNLAATDLSVS